MMSEDSKKSWAIGSGLEENMEGDPRPGSGAGLRFWMAPGSERKIIFLNDGNEFLIYWEHQVFLGGSWKNWFTCLQPMGVKCPLCIWAQDHDGQFSRAKVAACSIIDTHEFKDREGKTRKNLKKLMVCKKETTEVLKRQYLKRVENGERLKYALYDVYRSAKKQSPNVGDQFEFSKMLTPEQVPDNEPLDMMEILKPDPAKVKAVYEKLEREHGEAPPLEEGKDSEIPY